MSKTVVITGANRGIGLELARAYADAGYNLILGVRSGVDQLEFAAEIVPLDVRSDASVRAFAAALDGRTVDILINNAGIIGPERQAALDTDFDGFLETLNVNTLGPLRVTQALLPQLRRSAGAKVAIISSQMGSMSYARSDHVAYRASKAAANKVGQCLATDLAAEGIALALLHPGWVRTDMGGPNADLSPAESARWVKAVIDALTPATTGSFWDHDGATIAW